MNIKQQTFITEYLRHRSAFTAYCLAYNVKDASNYDSIMSSANRLLNHPEVSSVIDSVLEGIRQEVEQELRAEMKTEMLTIQRKRELLARIATGETYAVQNYKGKDCNMCTQHVWPTINQMLKAIDLDNKMVGLYTVYNRQSKSQQLTVEQLPKSQQNTTYTTETSQQITLENELSPAGGGVSELTGVGHSHRAPAPEKSDETATTPLRNNNFADEVYNDIDKENETNVETEKEDAKPQQNTTIQEEPLVYMLVSPLGG